MHLWPQLIRYSVELLFFENQVTLVYLVARQQRRRVHNYATGFFDVFVCKTLTEIAQFSLVSRPEALFCFHRVQSFAYLQIPATGVISKDAIGSPALVMGYYFFYCALRDSQQMCHALIAVDRYVIFRYPTEKVSSTKHTVIPELEPPGGYELQFFIPPPFGPRWYYFWRVGTLVFFWGRYYFLIFLRAEELGEFCTKSLLST